MCDGYLSGQKGQSTATGTGCATLEWRRMAQEGGAVARKVNVYTRHIRNTKGQGRVKHISLCAPPLPRRGAINHG